jgi:hypothetical protein
MRRVLCTLALLAVMALAMPIIAQADTISLTNQFGTVNISTMGISSVGSQLQSFNGIQANPGHSLGSVAFNTGALVSGSIWTGGVFSATGSSFVVKGVGNMGQPKGIIFNGAFEGPIDWTLVASSKLYHEYTLTGTIVGELYNGHMASGTTTQTIYTYWNQEKIDHKGSVHLGATVVSSSPEPGTLGLLGTGLVAMAGALRRKIVRP